MSKQSVTIHFQYSKADLSELRALEMRLRNEVGRVNAGEYDGNEIAIDLSDGFLYFYAPSANELWKAIQPVLSTTPWMKGAAVTVCCGEPGDDSRETLYVIE